MTNVITWKAQPKEKSKMEVLNEKYPVYLCYDCEFMPMLCTTNRKEAEQYAKDNFCTISFYPVNSYTEID